MAKLYDLDNELEKFKDMTAESYVAFSNDGELSDLISALGLARNRADELQTVAMNANTALENL
jgi:hypothetical protein